MIFRYEALTKEGEKKTGTIDAVNKDLAIGALQRRGFIVTLIKNNEEKSVFQTNLFERVALKDVVILSRQISTLFEAQVSALKAFSLLASNAENRLLSKKLTQVVDDLQAGFSISGALAKHEDVFSPFYVNMVKAGEESGKLTQTFLYLADYLDRQYELTSKTRNALVYPAFVIIVFITVMALMFVLVIPKLSAIIIDSGLEIPIYTRIIIAISNFFVQYGLLIIVFLIAAGAYIFHLSRSDSGKVYLDSVKLSIPGFGDLFKKLYLSRIADNLDTMLSSSIPVLRALEITGDVVGNELYKEIMVQAVNDVKAGISISSSFEKHEIIPPIMVQMVRVGEETGSLGSILKTLARFYKREVDGAVDTLIGLIEPIMIVGLGVGVGFLLTSILLPIYNIASSL
jgi:type IV pilus assembly protein PilC